MTEIIQDKHYLSTLEEIKHKVKNAQIKAHFAVNREMLILYWQIGKTILEKQEAEGWGAKITRKLAEDLTIAFPHMKGFSYTNIRYMQRFAENYPDLLICQQPAGKLETPAFATYFANFTLQWFNALELCHSNEGTDQRSSILV